LFVLFFSQASNRIPTQFDRLTAASDINQLCERARIVVLRESAQQALFYLQVCFGGVELDQIVASRRSSGVSPWLAI
jgi:hypothetical protein